MPESGSAPGQVLAVIDRSVQAQQAAQLAAQVEAARANASLAQSNYDRALALKDRGFVSKAELDSKKATRDAAYAQVRVAQAQLGATRAQIGQLNIIAPTAGLVLERNIEVGQIVSPGSAALFRLASGGEIEMRAELPQQDLAVVRVGMPATVIPLGLGQAIRRLGLAGLADDRPADPPGLGPDRHPLRPDDPPRRLRRGADRRRPDHRPGPSAERGDERCARHLRLSSSARTTRSSAGRSRPGRSRTWA